MLRRRPGVDPVVLAGGRSGSRERRVTWAQWTSVLALRDTEPVGPWDPFEDEAAPSAGSAAERALELLDRQANLLTSVATGGPKIDDVNPRYLQQGAQLRRDLSTLGLSDPFHFADLWEWYGYWSQHLPKYASRRDHISGLAREVRGALQARIDGVQVHDPGAPEGLSWPNLETRVAGIADELRGAESKDDLQDVGRRCREVLIDTAKLLADPLLVPEGEEAPRAADAKTWLDLFLRRRAVGRSHKELRAFVPTAWDLAQKVTHGDVHTVDAYAAAQATILLVRTLQMLANDTD